MPDTSDSSPDHLPPGSGQDVPATSSPAKKSSIIGLFLVSALNLACLAFIAFHFAGHSAEPAPIAVGPAETIELRPGNIDMAPATQFVLTIASHIDAPEGKPADRVEPISDIEISHESMPTKTADIEAPKESAEHWVQFGALSKEATAIQYWATLQKRHRVLKDLEPRIFGPDQVGGNLYHVRVGPMIAGEASNLCSRLEQAGADCFCVPSISKNVRAATTKATQKDSS